MVRTDSVNLDSRKAKTQQKTVIFPKVKKFFKNRPVIVLAGDASILTMQLPEGERSDKSQMVAI